MSEGEELAPLLGVVALAFGLDGAIFVTIHFSLFTSNCYTPASS